MLAELSRPVHLEHSSAKISQIAILINTKKAGGSLDGESALVPAQQIKDRSV
jgi:hypothetical protein